MIKTIQESIEREVKERFRYVLTKLDSIQKTIDILSGDLDSDRRDIAEIRTSMAKIEETMSQVMRMHADSNKKLTTTIEESTQEAVETLVGAVADQVEPAISAAADKMKQGVALKKRQWWDILGGILKRGDSHRTYRDNTSSGN